MKLDMKIKANTRGISKWVLTVALLGVGFSAGALADGDDNAIVRGGFLSQVQAAKGVVMRVEINARGEEKRDSATLRLHVGDAPVRGAADVQTAFTRGVDASQQPQLTAADLERDSNTHGWWRYHHRGWAAPYYYVGYTPVYYSYGYSYTFYNPTYYTVWAYPVSYRYYYWTW
jgi:hypothetical protein